MFSIKRKITFLSFLFFSFLNADEQNNSFDFKLYEDIGLTYSTLKTPSLTGNPKTGLTTGIQSAFLWNNIGFSLGVDYSNLKTNFNNVRLVDIGVDIINPKISASYLDFPINFVYVVENGSNSISLFIGPYLGVPLGDAFISFQGGTADLDLKVLFGANIKLFFLWNVGRKTDFGFDVFFKQSLSDISSGTISSSTISLTDPGKQSYTNYGFGLAFRFL